MTNTPSDDQLVGETVSVFCEIYLRGIPPLHTDRSAFLSFVCVLTATEALAEYRYGTGRRRVSRSVFVKFIKGYFPDEYHPHATNLWEFRNRMVHAFSPFGFTLTNDDKEKHFLFDKKKRQPILNAEDFYDAMRRAATKFFRELHTDPTRRTTMAARLKDMQQGGPIRIGPLEAV